jgi:hypothetical protein
MSETRKMTKVLQTAEMIDAMRVVPRIILALYTYGLYRIVEWYIEFELLYTTKCDSATLNVLMSNGVPLDQAQAIACSVSEVIGHPNGYTALVATMVGAAAVVFGLYSRSGRSWDGDKSKDVDKF